MYGGSDSVFAHVSFFWKVQAPKINGLRFLGLLTIGFGSGETGTTEELSTCMVALFLRGWGSRSCLFTCTVRMICREVSLRKGLPCRKHLRRSYQPCCKFVRQFALLFRVRAFFWLKRGVSSLWTCPSKEPPSNSFTPEKIFFRAAGTQQKKLP